MNNLLQHFSGQKQNNKEGQHDALTDTRHLKNICLEGAKRLGFQNYLEYLEKNPEQIQRLTKSGNIKRPRKKKAIAFSMKKASKHRTNVDASAAVFPNLVIYHELRDFGHSLREKILLLVTSHEGPKTP